jgi:hypothetical protein
MVVAGAYQDLPVNNHLRGAITMATKKGPVPSNNKENSEDERQFVFDKPPEELSPRERSLANLRKVTKEGRSLGRQRQLETQMLDRAIARNFKKNAKAYKKVLAEVPELSALDVIRMTIHMALQENDYEAAARWAKELAEYEKPKLQRVEKIVKNEVEDMTDEQLMERAIAEGLLPKVALMKLPDVDTSTLQ